MLDDPWAVRAFPVTDDVRSDPSAVEFSEEQGIADGIWRQASANYVFAFFAFKENVAMDEVKGG